MGDAARTLESKGLKIRGAVLVLRKYVPLWHRARFS
jgi:hypothetical protein